MYSVFEVANWFLKKERMTHKKVQKLCYYAQAWSYALHNEPLIDTEFQAWIHGPVSPVLYEHYKGSKLDYLHPDPNVETNFDSEAEELLDSIWITYGGATGNSLEVQTHNEPPWQNARRGCNNDIQCATPVSPEDMRSYYMSVYEGDLEVEA
jgi:uncharacterized phage-associated protein